MRPLVSVIVPNYNYGKYLRRTLESVLAQTYPNFEVIVVDDGSSDDSIAVLGTFAGNVTVIEQKNQGVSAARNNGVKRSSGEIVAFLDADDIWLPEKLEMQVEELLRDPEIGMVHCSMTYIDINEKIVGENREGRAGWLADDILRLESGCVVGFGSTGLVPRPVFDQAGGFDLSQTTSADWDLAYRIAVGHKIGFIERPLVLYRIHSSNMHSNIGAMEHDVRIGLAKAFADCPPATARLKRECYGNFHFMLAGSYFRAGKYPASILNGLKSMFYRPSNLFRLIARSSGAAGGRNSG